MLKQTELVLQPEAAANAQLLKKAASFATGIPVSEITFVIPRRRSVDARGKQPVIRIMADVYTGDTPVTSNISERKLQHVATAEPVCVIGCGPAGLFAALRLIELGYKPVILERGKDVKSRRRDLAQLNRNSVVNPNSNYCFGEGGAGTYSDGKLYTRSDKRGNVREVLDTFISFGASPDIAIDSHPHIGTNKLPAIISSMSEAIISCGGEILFNTRFTGFEKNKDGITGITCENVSGQSQFRLTCNAVILATGHSAADIFEYFNRENLETEAKPFALGVRVEHPQPLIDSIQYHCQVRSASLPPAPYALAAQANGRGVYSFCMCPGGIIAPAATAPGEVVVNGWSPSRRNNPFANSGLVVSTDESDLKPFVKDGNLRALRFQQSVERKAFIAGGSSLAAPAQRMMDFIDNRVSTHLPPCSYHPGIVPVNLHEVLPVAVAVSLQQGLIQFSKKMKGYLTNEAVLVATESRTSSPVRIPRVKETLMHPGLPGLFPCGEGAGYAGGIVSAAMDGERVAEACVRYLG